MNTGVLLIESLGGVQVIDCNKINASYEVPYKSIYFSSLK